MMEKGEVCKYAVLSWEGNLGWRIWVEEGGVWWDWGRSRSRKRRTEVFRLRFPLWLSILPNQFHSSAPTPTPISQWQHFHLETQVNIPTMLTRLWMALPTPFSCCLSTCCWFLCDSLASSPALLFEPESEESSCFLLPNLPCTHPTDRSKYVAHGWPSPSYAQYRLSLYLRQACQYELFLEMRQICHPAIKNLWFYNS